MGTQLKIKNYKTYKAAENLDPNGIDIGISRSHAREPLPLRRLEPTTLLHLRGNPVTREEVSSNGRRQEWSVCLLPGLGKRVEDPTS